MVYDIKIAMYSRMNLARPKLARRYGECDKDGHLDLNERGKCEYCYRSIDNDSFKGLKADAVKLGEKMNGLQGIVKERSPDFHKRYIDSFLSIILDGCLKVRRKRKR